MGVIPWLLPRIQGLVMILTCIHTVNYLRNNAVEATAIELLIYVSKCCSINLCSYLTSIININTQRLPIIH